MTSSCASPTRGGSRWTWSLPSSRPLETWCSAGEHSLASVAPGLVGITLPPKGERTVRFAVSGKPRMWAWAKLMCNGKADYKPVPGTTA